MYTIYSSNDYDRNIFDFYWYYLAFLHADNIMDWLFVVCLYWIMLYCLWIVAMCYLLFINYLHVLFYLIIALVFHCLYHSCTVKCGFVFSFPDVQQRNKHFLVCHNFGWKHIKDIVWLVGDEIESLNNNIRTWLSHASLQVFATKSLQYIWGKKNFFCPKG